ncbi:MAG TPA: hypothetical protein VHO29_13010 [Marmoricola sp.]|nr:hypothetical protein [Marmoricola sp.]
MSLGLAQLIAAHETTGYWSDLFLNTGAATLLLAPLYAMSAALGARVEQVRDQTTGEIHSLRTEVEASTQGLRTDIESLRAQVSERIQEADARQAAVVQTLREAPTAAVIRDALRDATRERVISVRGPRVRIVHPSAYIFGRFRLENESLKVDIERRDGTVINTIDWEDGTSATDLMLQVVETLRAVSMLPEPFDPGLAFVQLSELLDAHTKQKRRLALMEDASGLIESCGQWTIHDWGIVGWPEDSILPYVIELDRFDESDWHRHMAEKTWIDLDSFDQAMTTARLLAGTGNLGDLDTVE